jgi:hypothetical protein
MTLASSGIGDAEILLVSQRFSIPEEAIRYLTHSTVDEMTANYTSSETHPNNTTSPTNFEKYSIGTFRIAPYGGDLKERYIDYLTTLDPSILTTSEAEQGIKSHPSYALYKKWSFSGIEAPYISVYETESGVLQSTNRRRTLVAQEIGNEITAWMGPFNKESGLPLKYGDIADALIQSKNILLGNRHIKALSFIDESDPKKSGKIIIKAN